LGPAPAGHLSQVAPQQAAPPAALFLVLLLAQNLLHPAVNLLAMFAFEPDAFAGFSKSLDLIQVQLLCFVHAGCQSSACHLLQAHLVLETASSFRLILYWKRLRISCVGHSLYNERRERVSHCRPHFPCSQPLWGYSSAGRAHRSQR